MRISLDASSSSVYRKIRDSDAFERIVDNLKSMVALQKRNRVIKPSLSLWFLGTRQNIAQLPEFVRLSARIGVNQVNLQRLVYFQNGEGYGIANQDEALDETDKTVTETILNSQQLANELGVEFTGSGLQSPVDSVKHQAKENAPWQECRRPNTVMYITANGNVLPCCISPFSTIDYPSLILGNAFKTPLADIWNGNKYNRFRRQIISLDPPKCCQGCGVFWSL